MRRLPFQYQQRDFWEFFCPACKTLRRSFYWPSPRRKHYISLAVLAVAMTLFLWPWVGFKGFFLIFPIWGLFEVFYRSRARMSLICPYCSFDPYLYKYDVKLAREKMQKFFEQKAAAKSDGATVGATESGGEVKGDKK